MAEKDLTLKLEDKYVLVVDERNTYRGISAVLTARGTKSVLLDPTEDFTEPTEQYPLRAVVFEPYFVIGDSRRFRVIVDEILAQAKTENARRIALSSCSEKTLEEEGFVPGKHYEFYLRKPQKIKEICDCLIGP